MSDAVIEISGLRKSFKGEAALAGLDLQVPAGSIFGFLGRNGAGKTTTITAVTPEYSDCPRARSARASKSGGVSAT
jgi:ABC-type multidrug transport system ATPase subunit